MPVEEITSRKAFSHILRNSDDKLIIIDFYANWCGPCKNIAPFIKELSEKEEYSDILFFKINIEKLDDLADGEGVSSLPTFLFYKNNKQIGKVVGASRSNFLQSLAKYI